jgi:large subunit ribosomal protein L24
MRLTVKIKKGDTVEVISGKDKGKRGEVLRVLPKAARLVVQGLNLRRKHQRAQQAGGRQIAPEILVFEGQMDASNVMLVCPKCGELTRVGYRRRDDGKAARLCRQCESVIDG